MPSKARPAPVQNGPAWNGFYIGGDVGYAFANDDYVFDAATATALGLNGTDLMGSRGFSGGLLAGVNWMVAPRWVLGAEGDWSWQDVETRISVGPAGGLAGDIVAKQAWAASIRARLGYLVTPETMLYGTAGWAWSRYTLAISGVIGSISGSSGIDGFQVGIGMETVLASHWRGRIEYLHTLYKGASVFPGSVGVAEVNPSVGLGRVALIYQFGGPNGAPAGSFSRAPIDPVWSGLYLAGSIGGAVGYSELEIAGVANIKGVGLAGPLPSVLLGFNHRLGSHWLVGVEGELAPSVRSTDLKLGWLAAVRGRVGYLLTPDTLLYGSVGWVGTAVDDLTYGGIVVVKGQRLDGLQVGGGIEAAITREWRVRLDYQYNLMQGVDVNFPTVPVVTGSARPSGHIGRIAIVRQFTGL